MSKRVKKPGQISEIMYSAVNINCPSPLSDWSGSRQVARDRIIRVTNGGEMDQINDMLRPIIPNYVTREAMMRAWRGEVWKGMHDEGWRIVSARITFQIPKEASDGK